jgi:hypothetical protein
VRTCRRAAPWPDAARGTSEARRSLLARALPDLSQLNTIHEPYRLRRRGANAGLFAERTHFRLKRFPCNRLEPKTFAALSPSQSTVGRAAPTARFRMAPLCGAVRGTQPQLHRTVRQGVTHGLRDRHRGRRLVVARVGKLRVRRISGESIRAAPVKRRAFDGSRDPVAPERSSSGVA